MDIIDYEVDKTAQGKQTTNGIDRETEIKIIGMKKEYKN